MACLFNSGPQRNTTQLPSIISQTRCCFGDHGTCQGPCQSKLKTYRLKANRRYSHRAFKLVKSQSKFVKALAEDSKMQKYLCYYGAAFFYRNTTILCVPKSKHSGFQISMYNHTRLHRFTKCIF